MSPAKPKKLVPLVEFAKDVGATDTDELMALAIQVNALEIVAGIPHIVRAPFMKAYKAAMKSSMICSISPSVRQGWPGAMPNFESSSGW